MAFRRSRWQETKDFITFPLRAVTLFHRDRWGLSCLASQTFGYAANEVVGYCLDVGCGPNKRFVREYMGGNGEGIDVYAYEGLTGKNIVEDITRFPFDACTFESVTFLANLNHIPRSLRDIELSEAYRCLKPGGNIIVTMGNPPSEIAVHKVVELYDKLFGTRVDVDSERGMDEEEEYYLRDKEITDRLHRAGFVNVEKKHFLTQWGLNHLFVGWRPSRTSHCSGGDIYGVKAE